jgi:HK97 family phage portal protein
MGLRQWLLGKPKTTALTKIKPEQLPPGAQVLPMARPLTIPQIQPTGGEHQVEDVVSGYWFSALQPIKPMAPAGQRIRQYEIQPGANIAWTPKTEIEGMTVGFPILRSFADSWDLLRLVIETVKDRLCAAEREFRLVRKKGEKQVDYEKRTGADARIDQLTKFFQRPDGFHYWSTWLRPILEDMLVCDNASVYMERDKNGRIANLMGINGDTISRMLTDQGLTPPAPQVAYQQILYGLPAHDMTVDDLVYAMRNPRHHRRYGFGPVEQIMITIATGLNVQKFKLDYFTSGNVPEALCFLPQDVPVQRIKEVQQWFDSILAGDLAQRRRMIFLPGYGTGKEARPNVMFSKEVLLKDPLDEWLWQIVCYAFGVPSQALLRMMNRATAQQNVESAEEEGLGPKLEWIASLINYIVQTKMGFADLEFAWSQAKEVDIEKQANVDKTYVSCAVKTINEVRDGLGLDPLPYPEADEPGVMTQNGFVPLTGGIVTTPGAAGSGKGDAGGQLIDNLQAHADAQEMKQQARSDQAHSRALELQTKAPPPTPPPAAGPTAEPAIAGKGKPKKALTPSNGDGEVKCEMHGEDYTDGCFRCAVARLDKVERVYDLVRKRKFRIADGGEDQP